ncbi:MAG: hypothetical protein SFY80_09865 [Verrucomicrobiota bacterium]|nr:hypothetical protein [Verrucomicrobiota bacterium]
MMKFIKITFWILLACFILAIALGLAALFSPGIQKAIVLGILKDDPDNRVKLEYFHVGFTSGEIRNAYLFNKTQGISVEKAVFDYSLMALLFDHELYIERCELKGLLIDASKPGNLIQVSGDVDVAINTGTGHPESGDTSPANSPDASSTTEPGTEAADESEAVRYDGFYHVSTKSKAKLRIENMAMDGRILLPDQKQVAFNTTAQGIAPGSTGTLNFTFEFTDKTEGAELSKASGRGLFSITQATAGGVSAMGAELSLAAEGAAFQAPAKFAMKLESISSDSLENHSMTITAGDAGKTLATVKTTIDFTGRKQAGTFMVDIATADFSMLPATDTLPPVALKGSGTFGGNLDQSASNLQGQFTITEARPEAMNEIGTLILDVKQNPDGIASINIPLTLRGPSGATVITTTGTVQKRAADRNHFVIAVNSPAIYVDDLIALKNRLIPPATESDVSVQTQPESEKPSPVAVEKSPASTQPATAPETSTGTEISPVPDALPCWHKVSGEFTMEIKKIVANGNTLENFSSRLTIDEKAVTLTRFTGTNEGTPITAQGALTFTAGADKPYALNAAGKISKFDVGSFLKKRSPGKTPYLECDAAMDFAVTGEAPTLEVLGRVTRGQCHIITGSGVMRPIASAGKNAETGLALAGIAGSLFGNKVSGLGALTQILESLREVPFDRVEILAVRESDLNMNLKTLDLRSPSLHITGAGTLNYDAMKPIMHQPLSAQLTFALKGDSSLARKFNEARLLTGKRDSAGLYYGPTFEVKGTATDPKSNLVDVLKDAIARGLTTEPIKLN